MSEPMPGVQRHVDLNAPVQRFSVGDRVTWHYGEARPRAGIVAKVFEFDSIYCDGTGDGYAPWGMYLGRITHIVCNKLDCHCQGNTTSGEPFYHVCNECQLTTDTRAAVSVTLF